MNALTDKSHRGCSHTREVLVPSVDRTNSDIVDWDPGPDTYDVFING